MKRMLLVLALALSGCISGAPIAEGMSSPVYWHDDAHEVGCWTFGSSIDCMPDSEYTR